MKKVVEYFKSFLSDHFQLTKYLVILAFIGVLLVINYSLDFEDSILDTYSGRPVYVLYYFLFLGIPYFGTVILQALFSKTDYLQQIKFWYTSLFFVGLIALDSSFYWHNSWIEAKSWPELRYYGSILKNLINLLTQLLPLMIFYMLVDRERSKFYGLFNTKPTLLPYLYLLLVMVPILYFASLHPNFSNFYPMYKPSHIHEVLEVPKWQTVSLYELAYGWNFISIELLFRGALIIGLTRIMGRDAVLPMVAMYCCYHFGKPEGEAISSIFGGFILGVIAYESRSILGGVMIHLGIAWLMEVFGFLN